MSKKAILTFCGSFSKYSILSMAVFAAFTDLRDAISPSDSVIAELSFVALLLILYFLKNFLFHPFNSFIDEIHLIIALGPFDLTLS